MMKIISTTLLTLALSQSVLAENAENIVSFDLSKLYSGVGFSHNRIDQSSFGGSDAKASGIQVFAGYEYGTRNSLDISAEAGLIQTGKFVTGFKEDADGVWVAGVVSKDLPEIDDKLSAIVRLGYGLGGDDGLLMGFGAQYRVLPQAFVRLEYLNKDLTQSYQVNAIYKF
jgi:hypothetical protein